jgi:hypothetical protein
MRSDRFRRARVIRSYDRSCAMPVVMRSLHFAMTVLAELLSLREASCAGIIARVRSTMLPSA